jgi:hypothetical protein
MQELRLFSAEELARASAQIADTFGEAHKAGLPADAALRGAGEKFADMVMERAGAVADAMQQQGPAAAQRRSSGEAELAAQWGEALGLYYMATLAAAELGVLSADRHRRAQAHPDSCQAALAWLHARACQTSFEVHALLSAGYPGGAYARLRTLHELAVTAAVIAGYGRQPQHAGLAERYLQHMDIEQYQQAVQYQRSSRELGLRPLTARTVRRLKKTHDDLITRYGVGYRESYGWAEGLISPPLTFAKLEAKADMRCLRYLYTTSSHHIHASAHGLRLTSPRRDGSALTMLAGPTSTGLAQPAQGALHALVDVTGGLLLHAQLEPGFTELLNLAGLHELRNRAVDHLNQAETQQPERP